MPVFLVRAIGSGGFGAEISAARSPGFGDVQPAKVQSRGLKAAGARLSIPPQAATYLCQRLDAHLHPLLRVGRLPVESTEEDRHQAEELGRRQLVERQLLEHDDLHPFLDEALHLLAKPPLAVGAAVHREQGRTSTPCSSSTVAAPCRPTRPTVPPRTR